MGTVVAWTVRWSQTPSQKHVEDTGELLAQWVGSRNGYPVSCRDWGAPQGTVRYSDPATQAGESISKRGLCVMMQAPRKRGKKVPMMINGCGRQGLDAVTPQLSTCLPQGN